MIRRVQIASILHCLPITTVSSVVTVPAYFNVFQSHSTSSHIAGLEVLRVITSAPGTTTLAFCLDKTTSYVIAVYDLGKGIFDISIIKLQRGVFEVKSMNGVTHLSGKDSDVAIINRILSELRKESGVGLIDDQMAIHRVREVA